MKSCPLGIVKRDIMQIHIRQFTILTNYTYQQSNFDNVQGVWKKITILKWGCKVFYFCNRVSWTKKCSNFQKKLLSFLQNIKVGIVVHFFQRLAEQLFFNFVLIESKENHFTRYCLTKVKLFFFFREINSVTCIYCV